MPAPARTPFPFNHTQVEFDMALRRIPTRDLIAELEAAQWVHAEVADINGGEFARLQVERIGKELLRRQRIAKRRPDLAPKWPKRDLSLRVAAVKDAWPIERFCTEMLGCQLVQLGRNWKAKCPLPGHDDRTPSFVVYPDGHAWCHGCNRGGDVIKLTQFVFNIERFYEALERLERESGLAA